MLLGIILYCTVFALAWAWGLVWILERREKKYLQGSLSFTDAFLAGSFFLVFVYISNIVVLVRWPRYAFVYDILLTTALAGFMLYKESRYRALAALRTRRQHAEVRLLELHLKKDPGNASYYERLSEVHEKLGNREQALETARMAAKLEPTVRNTWRLKNLEGN
ncbi:MAG: hypothetical protein NDI60_06045 [Elusimicrobiales bacterium]|nr:hypothetical protein [Elusimicrobiales bacterium]